MYKEVKKKLLLKGFTLVELIVSVSIMVMILTITLSGRSEALLRLSLADEVSSAELLIRQAQLQGSAVNSVNDQFGGAGVYFDRASSTRVVSFRDQIDTSIQTTIGIGDGLYNQSLTLERNELSIFTRGSKLGKLCVSSDTFTYTCNDATDPYIKNLTISFKRPSQDANIYINNATTTNYSSACIQFDSNKSPEPGYVRSLFIYRSGLMIKKLDVCP